MSDDYLMLKLSIKRDQAERAETALLDSGALSQPLCGPRLPSLVFLPKALTAT